MTTVIRGTRQRYFLLALAVGSVALMVMASSASAAPAWRIHVAANPTAPPGGQAQFLVQMDNVGDEVAEGKGGDPLVLTVALDPGLTVDNVAIKFGPAVFDVSTLGWTCEAEGGGPIAGAANGLCEIPEAIGPWKRPGVESFLLGPLVPTVTADVSEGATGTLTGTFSASGAGAVGSDTTVETVRMDPAAPAFGVSDFDVQVSADAAGTPFTQAAGNPYAASTAVELYADDEVADPLANTLWPVEPVKDIVVHIPPGFVGNPTAADKCALIDLASSFGAESRPLCPPTSQVGTLLLRRNFPENVVIGPIAVYNMESGPDVPARFGFAVSGSTVLLDAELRSDGDYGVTVRARNAPVAFPTQATDLTLWGVPADEVHKPERTCPDQAPPWQAGDSCASGAPLKAFLRNPTSCTPAGVGLPVTVEANSWFDPADYDTRTIHTHLPPAWPAAPEDWGPQQGPDGCGMVPFNPSLTAQPDASAQAGQPSGFAFDLSLPQTDEPGAIGQADLRKAEIVLPPELRINAASAGGLGACGLEEANLDTRGPVDCPPSSKIGTVEVDTPLLEDPLQGSVYLGKQFDNPFDSLLAIYLVAEASGVVVKLPGRVEAMPDGQVKTIFDDQPQLPFSNLHLELKGGPRAPFTLPETCGTHTIEATFTGWNGKVAQRQAPFQVGDCGPETFAPALNAGVDNPVAGAHSPFTLQVKRSDADQELRLVDVTTPEGLTAALKGIPFCSQVAIDAAKAMGAPGQGALELAGPACPAASQIGTALVGAGAGPSPFYVDTGRVYLAGAYKGAPLSLAVVAPALAGPFDLGTVVVQTALHVDPKTARIQAASDPLPSILHGIPLDLRDVRIRIDRPGFMLNPTSCEEMSVDAVLGSVHGATATASDRFQVADCASLGFKPRLRINLKGGTKRSRFPALRTELVARPGDANIGRVRVTLPRSEFLAQQHLGTSCTRVQFAAGNGSGDGCPANSVYGYARAWTPLLDEPLEGPVYLRSNGGERELPDLVAALRGIVDVELEGHIDSHKGRIRTTFQSVPDAPVRRFVLSMKGGRKGLLENSTDICRGKHRATVQMDGQNGRIRDIRPLLKAPCGEKARKGRR